jgi:hypothetical protein
MQGVLITFIQIFFAKAKEITMDKLYARKLARVVLIKGEDKNPIGIFQCVELCI